VGTNDISQPFPHQAGNHSSHDSHHQGKKKSKKKTCNVLNHVTLFYRLHKRRAWHFTAVIHD